MRRIVAVALALIGVALVLSNATWRKRKQERAILDDRLADYANGEPISLVDVGVRLITVVADPKGEELLPDRPRLRVLRERKFGGLLDVRAAQPTIIAKSSSPRTWFCSEDQEDALFSSDPATPGMLVNGSEGAGKTRLLAMFHYLMWLRLMGRGLEAGQTAPVQERLGAVKAEMLSMYGRDWIRWRQERNFTGFRFCDGTCIRFRYTRRRSAEEGSPIQSYNWAWWAGDEIQDSTEAMPDVLARGRAAPGGIYRQLATATAKDSPKYRSMRDELLASGRWTRRTLLGPRTPFVWPTHWEAMKATMSEREYKRRVLALDVAPELAVYYGWDRKRNLVVAPRIATDVTRAVLASYAPYLRPRSRFSLLASHDPGNIYNATELARMIMFGDVPTWVVVGEVWSKQTTQREHARLVRRYVTDRFGIEFAPEGENVIVFCDPHGKGEAQTDYQTVYMAFQHEGLEVYNPAPMSGRIKRSARVGMMNRLLGDANGVARLVVATDERGLPVAPHLVEAFETLEKREGEESAEGTHRKDEADKTHAPAALGYGLHPFEQEAMTETTIRIARAEARRYG